MWNRTFTSFKGICTFCGDKLDDSCKIAAKDFEKPDTIYSSDYLVMN